MISVLLTFLLTLTAKIIGVGILVIIFIVFLRWRFKTWKKFEEEMKFYEVILIRNIGVSCMTLIIVFLGFLIANSFSEVNILSTEYLLTGIGVTVAFWYSYKKYERDKEIELIKYYSEKYNQLNAKVKTIDENNVDEIINSFSELINLWYSEYHLWKQGYISDMLWNDWEYWIKSDTFYYIDQGRAGYNPKFGGDYGLQGGGIFDIYFLKALSSNIGFFKFSKDKKYRDMSWKGFLLMLRPTIDECYQLMDKHTKAEIKELGSYKYTHALFEALNSDLID